MEELTADLKDEYDRMKMLVQFKKKKICLNISYVMVSETVT